MQHESGQLGTSHSLEMHSLLCAHSPPAATVPWILNRSFTFRRDAPSAFAHPATEWLSYLGLMLIGGVANYGAYALAIATSETVRAHVWLGVALGSLAGMVINFWTSKRIIFERSPGESRGRGS